MMELNELTEKLNRDTDNFNENAEDKNMNETTIEENKNIKEKLSGNKKLKAICIAGASVILVAIVCVIMYVKNPLRIFEEAYWTGDFKVAENSYDDMKPSQKDKAIAIVLEDCNTMLETYNQGELSYDEIKFYFTWIDEMVNSESEELRELNSNLEELKISKDTFEIATMNLKTLKSETENSDNCTEVYEQVMISLSSVLESDANFEKVEALMKATEEAYVNNMIAIAEHILNTKDYENAPSIIEKALEILPENEKLLSAKVSIVEEGVVKKEQEKKSAEALTLKVLKDILEAATAEKVLSAIKPRTLVAEEFVDAKLFAIGEDAQWGLLICVDDNCKLYMDDGEAFVPVLDVDGAISYSTSADGKLIVKVSEETVPFRVIGVLDETQYATRTYYTIGSTDEIVSEVFKRDKTLKGDNVTRVYRVGGTELSEEEFYQRENVYKENVWTDITTLVDIYEKEYEVCVNTADSVAIVQAELDALIAERTN